MNDKTRLWIAALLAIGVLSMVLLACCPVGKLRKQEAAPTPIVSQPTEALAEGVPTMAPAEAKPTTAPAEAAPTKAPAEAKPTKAPALPKPGGVKLTEEYKSAAGGFSVKYPEGWATLGFGPMVVIAESEEALEADEGSAPVVLLTMDTLAEVVGYTGLDEADITDPAQLLDVEEEEDVELSEIESLIVGGYPAASVVAKGKVDEGQEAVGRIVSVLLEDRVLNVIAMSPRERWDEMEPIFDAMIDSLSFFPPEEGAAEMPLFPEETPAAPGEAPSAPTEAAEGGQVSYDTVFPLPDDVQNFTGEGGESQVNFQTSLSLDEVIAFYRQAFADQGLTERTLLTTVTDTAFSMVFDGWPNGKAIVIQGVDLGTSTNVNIRFEDV